MVTLAPTALVLTLVIFVITILFFRGNNTGLKLVGGGIVLAFLMVPFIAYLRVAEVSDSRNASTLPHYSSITLQPPSPPDFAAHDRNVADIYSSSEEAAKSLARQLAAALQIDQPQPAPLSVRVDREKSANAGRDVTETAQIINAFEQQLRASKSFHGQPPVQEMISVAIRRLTPSDENTQTLSISFERNGDPRQLNARFADKVWVRQSNEFSRRPGTPRKFFVASGAGSDTEDSQVIKQVASTILPIVRANWYYISSDAETSQDALEEFARELVIDRFSQRFISTVAGTPLNPADEKLFLLVDYSDDKVISAFQRVRATRTTVASSQTEVTWRGLAGNLASLGILCFLVTAIYFVLYWLSRKFDLQERPIVTGKGA